MMRESTLIHNVLMFSEIFLVPVILGTPYGNPVQRTLLLHRRGIWNTVYHHFLDLCGYNSLLPTSERTMSKKMISLSSKNIWSSKGEKYHIWLPSSSDLILGKESQGFLSFSVPYNTISFFSRQGLLCKRKKNDETIKYCTTLKALSLLVVTHSY